MLRECPPARQPWISGLASHWPWCFLFLVQVAALTQCSSPAKSYGLGLAMRPTNPSHPSRERGGRAEHAPQARPPQVRRRLPILNYAHVHRREDHCRWRCWVGSSSGACCFPRARNAGILGVLLFRGPWTVGRRPVTSDLTIPTPRRSCTYSATG